VATTVATVLFTRKCSWFVAISDSPTA